METKNKQNESNDSGVDQYGEKPINRSEERCDNQ